MRGSTVLYYRSQRLTMQRDECKIITLEICPFYTKSIMKRWSGDSLMSFAG